MKIAWKERFALHYQELDDQHRGLLDLLNRLLELLARQSSGQDLTPVFQELARYALEHFAREEFYMGRSGFPGLADHRRLHAQFVRRLLDFNHRYRPDDPLLLEELVEFLRSWLVDHITGSDFEFAPHLQRFASVAKVEALVFDFGNVLASFDTHLFVDKIAAGAARSAEEIQRLLYHPTGLSPAYERGELGSSEFFAQAAEAGGIQLSLDEFRDAYCGIFAPVPAMPDLLARLKKRFRLGLISNTSPWHAEHVIGTHESFSLFDAVTFSFQVGVGKPDRRIFFDLLGKLDLMAEQCIYIDDLPEFVAAAGESRFRALRFTSCEKLEADLRRLGLDFEPTRVLPDEAKGGD